MFNVILTYTDCSVKIRIKMGICLRFNLDRGNYYVT